MKYNIKIINYFFLSILRTVKLRRKWVRVYHFGSSEKNGEDIDERKKKFQYHVVVIQVVVEGFRKISSKLTLNYHVAAIWFGGI